MFHNLLVNIAHLFCNFNSQPVHLVFNVNFLFHNMAGARSFKKFWRRVSDKNNVICRNVFPSEKNQYGMILKVTSCSKFVKKITNKLGEGEIVENTSNLFSLSYLTTPHNFPRSHLNTF